MMNKVERLTLQQQIESLTIILEHWLPVLEQMELIKSNLENLPTELEKIQQNLNNQKRKQTKSKNEELSGMIAFNKEANTQKMLNLKLKNILTSLDAETPRLIRLGENINNLVCLREIIEALQERIEIQSNNDDDAGFQLREKKEQNNIFKYIRHSWQNLSNQTKFNRKIKLTLVFGLLLSWNLLSNFIYTQTVNKNIDNKVTNMETRLETLERDRLSD